MLLGGRGPKKGAQPEAPAAAVLPEICTVGPDSTWDPAMDTQCRVPLEAAQPWGAGGVAAELRGAGSAEAGVTLRLKSAAQYGQEAPTVDIPWAAGPGGRGRLAGNLRILDGPEGECKYMSVAFEYDAIPAFYYGE